MGFETIYRQTFDQVWRTLQRLGVAEKDALDAAQEVFLVVHRRLDEFEGRSSLPTWLYGIAVRVAADRRKRASERHELLGRDPATEPACPAPSPEELAGLHERLRLLGRVLDSLPDEQRVVLTLFEMEELTGEQIAEVLEIPVGTVRSRLRLAREAFSRAAHRLATDRGRVRRGGVP